MHDAMFASRVTEGLAARVAMIFPLHTAGLEDARFDATIMNVPRQGPPAPSTVLVLTARGAVLTGDGRVLVVMTAIPEFGYCSDEQLEAAIAEGCGRLRTMKKQQENPPPADAGDDWPGRGYGGDDWRGRMGSGA